jgi:hypothetical protein
VSETCFYVSQRLVPKFKARRRQVPRLPKDADGNPVETKNEHETYYDSDDDAVAPSETLGYVEVAGSFFTDPAVLLKTPTEVAYLGIKPNEGSGLPLYAANASDAERLNRNKTPTFSLFSEKLLRGVTSGVVSKSDDETSDEKKRLVAKEKTKEESTKAFHASVLSLDDVLFDAAAQGSEMMRDMRLAERETFSLMHNRSGMPLRFRYLEFDVPLCRAKLEAIARRRELYLRGGLEKTDAEKTEASASAEKDGREISDDDDRGEAPATGKGKTNSGNSGATRKNKALRFFGVEAEKKERRDEPTHAWDPRLIASRPGNVARVVATAYFEDVHKSTVSMEKEALVEKLAGAPTLRFFAAGALVPLSCVRPFALSEVAYAYAGTKAKKKRVYQTDTHSKKVLDATGFVWYTVAKSDVPKLAKYLREMVSDADANAESENASRGKRRPNGESHSHNVRSLLDADSCDLRSPGLWLDPGAIARWNAEKEHGRDRIVVQRHVQRVGEHFARAPGAARWGVCVGGCWLAESRFAFPEDYASLSKDAEETEKKSAVDVPKTSLDASDDAKNRVFAGARAETRKALAAEALLEAAAAAAKKNGEERGA